jgi:hypothetical protein
MRNEISYESRVVEEQVRSLGSLPHAPAPPEPELLWMRAQIFAREEAALRALRDATLARTLRYGFVAAGVAWLFAEGTHIDTRLHVMVSTASVTEAILAAFAAAALLSGLVLGHSFVTQRLRDLGLL